MSPSVYDRLVSARQLLAQSGITPDEAALDAEVLARHVLEWDRAALVARWRDAATDTFNDSFDLLIKRRAAREPVAYIIGHREFWGLDFEVTPDVLIPRPETELLVEEALRYAAEVHAPGQITDVGTGSGCLAIALAHELPCAHVTATDISDAALAVTRRNAERHGVAERITTSRCHLLDSGAVQFELIVSNLPYVPNADASELQPEVGLHEPPAALFGGPDGLNLIRQLLDAAPSRLAPDGRLMIEFGLGQERGVREAAASAGWQIVRVCNDLQGLPRAALLRRGNRD